MTGRATARDVADLAGCSVATVSLVVNGKSAGRVTPETEQRVLDAVRELDYRVNTTASSLATRDRTTVAFVSPDPTNPFFSLVVEGLSDALDDRLSLTLLVPSHGDDYDPSTVRRALAGDLAGLVLVSPGRALLDDFTPTSPTVLLDGGGPRDGLATIDLDLESAAVEIADHLVGLGHTRVAYIGIARDKASLYRRRDALAVELTARGASMPVDDLLVPRMASELADAGFESVCTAWRDAGVTAVVCGDDLLAYGVLSSAARLGIAVPGDLSVIGFNDLPFSSMLAPSLTSIDLMPRELGRRTALALGALLAGSEPGAELLPARLKARESTGPVGPTE